jgi:5-formyltetrahydrofolate cyclo-ligase
LLHPDNSKEAHRQAAFQKRLRVPTAAAKLAAHQMMETFLLDVPLKTGAIIAGYWPVNAEINVLPLMIQLQNKGYACALPQMIKKNAPLAFLSWNEKMPMRVNAYGIKEPVPTKSTLVRPDVLIVPMLAFDPTGGRMGYGLGFYSLTLRHLRAGAALMAVGTAYDLQKLDRVPPESLDCTVDMIVTDKNVYTSAPAV